MIQWYPGHMAKAIREISDKIKIVDLVIILLDARCPRSSFNPLLSDVLKNKKCLYVLTKKDKADIKETKQWLAYFQKHHMKAIALDARDSKNDKIILKEAQDLMKEKREKDLENELQNVEQQKEEINKLHDLEMIELQKVAALTKEEAKSRLLSEMDKELTAEKAALIREHDQKAKETISRDAKEMLCYAIQKCAADHSQETTVSIVALPNDEMKGRIIGREGRNIKALETLTGIDLIIDDTPEAVVLSGFDPLRREVAKIALEKLIEDGRIHPAKIEEMVEKAKEELRARYSESAKKTRNDYLQSAINGADDYSSNVQSGADDDITKQNTARQKYLESLGN